MTTDWLGAVGFVYVVGGGVFLIEYLFEKELDATLPGAFFRFVLWPYRLFRYAVKNWRDL